MCLTYRNHLSTIIVACHFHIQRIRCNQAAVIVEVGDAEGVFRTDGVIGPDCKIVFMSRNRIVE